MAKKEKKEKKQKVGKTNIFYVIGIAGAIAVFLFGCVSKVVMAGGTLADGTVTDTMAVEFNFKSLINFFDPASILITIGCTLFVVVASFPVDTLKDIPKHFKMLLHTHQHDPLQCIDQLAELAQVARKDGLLSLEERANQLSDPFFRQALMLLVDAYDADKIRSILSNDIDNMSARHDDTASMYDKASSMAPAFGMVGTLVGLVNMLKSMDLEGGANTLGSDMGTALITTLYGCLLAHIVFGPIATILRQRDEEEVLYKMLIVEGVMSIQAGENPKFLRERLMTFVSQSQREGGGKKKKGKKGKKNNRDEAEAEEE